MRRQQSHILIFHHLPSLKFRRGWTLGKANIGPPCPEFMLHMVVIIMLGQADVDIWKPLPKAHNHRRNDVGCRTAKRGQPHRPPLQAAMDISLPPNCLDMIQNLTGVVDHLLANRCQYRPMSASKHQRHPQLCFQGCHRMTDRRLRHRQLECGVTKTALLGHRHQDPQLRQLDVVTHAVDLGLAARIGWNEFGGS